MNVFQELTIEIQGSLDEMSEKITAALPLEWRRDTKREERRDLTSTIFAFIQKRYGDDYALLVLYVARDKSLSIANIVPMQKREFNIGEYNEVLGDFSKVLDAAGVIYSISKASVELEDLIGSDAAEKLKVFSSAANKSTGRSHPMDERRWLSWVFCMVTTHKEISFEQLTYFLEQQGWDDESAYQLALDYEYGSEAMDFVLVEFGRDQ